MQMVRGAAHLSNVHLNAVYTAQPIHHNLYCDLTRKPPHDSPRLREIWSWQLHSSSFLSGLGSHISILVTPAGLQKRIPVYRDYSAPIMRGLRRP